MACDWLGWLLDVEAEAERKKMNWKSMWNKLRSNPFFAAGWSAFAGALGKELYTALQGGGIDWSIKSWQQMGAAAASAAALALVHLYTTPPNQVPPPPPPPAA